MYMESQRTHHHALPLLGAEGIDKVILASSSWPDGSHLAETGSKAKVAEDTENKAVKQGDRPSGGKDETDGTGQSDPGAVNRVSAMSNTKRRPRLRT
jgi:hypothetical protein